MASSSSWERRPEHAHLPLLIHLREELVHVCQVFVLKEKALRRKGPWCAGVPRGQPRGLPPMGAVAGPGGPSAFTAPARLNRRAGVIQLKNNLPGGAIFIPGLVPGARLAPDPHVAESPGTTTGEQQEQQLREHKQAGLGPEVTEQGQCHTWMQKPCTSSSNHTVRAERLCSAPESPDFGLHSPAASLTTA